MRSLIILSLITHFSTRYEVRRINQKKDVRVCWSGIKPGQFGKLIFLTLCGDKNLLYIWRVSPVILSKIRLDLQQENYLPSASAGSRLHMHIPAPDQSYTTTALYMVRKHSFSVCHLLFPAQCPSDKFYYLQTSLSQFLSRVNKLKLTTNTPAAYMYTNDQSEVERKGLESSMLLQRKRRKYERKYNTVAVQANTSQAKWKLRGWRGWLKASSTRQRKWSKHFSEDVWLSGYLAEQWKYSFCPGSKVK